MAQSELAQENKTSEQNEVITECAENPSFERYHFWATTWNPLHTYRYNRVGEADSITD